MTGCWCEIELDFLINLLKPPEPLMKEKLLTLKIKERIFESVREEATNIRTIRKNQGT